MDEAERIRIGEERKLIFQNIANGVPVESVCASFHKSAMEVQRDVTFVLRKLREYRFRRATHVPHGTRKGQRWDAPGGGPPVTAETYAEIRAERFTLLPILEKCGPLYLSSDLLLPKITIQKIDHPEMATEVGHRLRHA